MFHKEKKQTKNFVVSMPKLIRCSSINILLSKKVESSGFITISSKSKFIQPVISAIYKRGPVKKI